MSVVKALLRAGASLEARDSLGFTPLDQAVGEGNSKIVKLLLDSGASVNGRTRNGSPLHTACTYRHLEIVKLLMRYGGEGNTPSDITKTKSNSIDKVIQNLLSAHTASLPKRPVKCRRDSES